MNLADVLTQSAQFVINSNVTVERECSYSTVSFYHNNDIFAFLQGHEADEFNDECERVYNEVQTLGMGVVELALAEPYLIMLEG
ncbi:MAG: hypothetical protein ACXW1D_00395 [Halobacteriota archaeon]